MVAMIGMASALCVLGYYFWLQKNDMGPNGSVAIVCVILYIAFFSLGLGAIPWLMMSEIFPANIRGLASSVVTLFNWTMSFVITETFTKMISAMSEAGVFFFFAAVCISGVVFVMTSVPETKGKTLEEIEAYAISFSSSVDVVRAYIFFLLPYSTSMELLSATRPV